MNGDAYWLSLQADIFDNRKIKLMLAKPEGDSFFKIWIKVLCIALKSNSEGKLFFSESMPYSDEMIALELNCSPQDVHDAIDFFIKFKMITKCKDKGNVVYIVKNWAKYQHADKLAQIRKSSRDRQRRHRALAQERNDCHVTETLPSRDVTPQEREKDLPCTFDNQISITGECSDARAKSVEKSLHGKYNNVLLSAEEIKNLKEIFPDDWQDRIDNLSGYLYMHPEKHYPSHYRVIRVWEQQDAQKGKTGATSGTQRKSAFHEYEQREYTDAQMAEIELAMRNRH